MLDAMKKLFNKKEETEMKDGNTTETLNVQTESAQLSAIREELEAFKAEANALVAQADAEKAELKNQIEALLADKAEMVAQAKAAKLSARKEKVIEMIGTERADALMTATAEMDDAGFTAVLTAMSIATETEEKGKMFTEQGVDAEADATKVVADPVQKLAANLAAQFNPK